jgi:hypothetical protein
VNISNERNIVALLPKRFSDLHAGIGFETTLDGETREIRTLLGDLDNLERGRSNNNTENKTKLEKRLSHLQRQKTLHKRLHIGKTSTLVPSVYLIH